MKKGFTMIELIFVIVILGILATVAIPKIMATRTDAKVTTDLQAIELAKADIIAYYTSKGVLEDNASLMSNAIKSASVKLDKNDLPKVSFETAKVIYKTEDNGVFENCIVLNYGDNASSGVAANNTRIDDRLYIQYAANNDIGTVCEEVRKVIKEDNFAIRGSEVER